MFSLFGLSLFHARWIVQMAVLFGGISLELDWEPCRLPCKLERCVSQAVTYFTRGPLELHIDTVTHSSVTKAFILFSASWFCLNNSAFRQVHFVWDQTIYQLFWVFWFFLDTVPGNSVLLISHSFLPLSKTISPPFLLSFLPQGQTSV